VSWLDRLLQRAARNLQVNVNVKRRESLNLTVPTTNADAVRKALEQWLAGYGITTSLTIEDAGDGKTRIKTQLREEDAARLDLADDAVQSQLQDVLTDAVSSSPSSW
jgi:hypothetical protein